MAGACTSQQETLGDYGDNGEEQCYCQDGERR